MNNKLSVPSWDQYFLSIAKVVATRSPDPNTKHGCVIVNKKNRIVSTGYNGPLQGIDDEQVPLTRPAKYDHLLHSEENALLFSTESLEGCTAYITGHPCVRCFRSLAQKGVVRIAFGNLMAKCVTASEVENIHKMAKLKNILLEQIE